MILPMPCLAATGAQPTMRVHLPIRRAVATAAFLALPLVALGQYLPPQFGGQTVANPPSALGVSGVGADGAATAQVQLVTPKGRVGLHVKLQLTYNSSRADPGWFSEGWDLGIPVIRVTPKYGAHPNTRDPVSVFALEEGGASHELVELCEDAACQRRYFRFKVDDGRFLRFERTASGSWTELDKNGHTRVFGGSASSEIRSPTDASHSEAWYLTLVHDQRGNFITYTYERPTPTSIPYLKEIAYTGGSGVAPDNRIRFAREARDAPHVSYRGGFRTTVEERIKSIETFTDVASGAEVKVAKFSLSYTDDALTGVQRFGGAGAEAEALPAQTFSYAPRIPRTSFTVPAPGKDVIWCPWVASPCLYGERIRLAGDFDGDGVTEVAYATLGGHEWTLYKLNATSLSSQVWPIVNAAGATTVAYDRSRQEAEMEYHYVGDFNGDGRADIARIGPWNGVVLFISNGHGFDWSFVSSGSVKVVDPYDMYDFPQIADLDGDGRDDFFLVNMSGGSRKVIALLTRVGQSGVLSFDLVARDLEAYANWFVLGDFNGDGLSEIAYQTLPFGTTWKMLRLEEGFSDKGAWPGPPINLTELNVHVKYAVFDVNGDGLTDIRGWYCSAGSFVSTDYLSTGASFAAEPQVIVPLEGVACPLGLIVGDRDGDRRLDTTPILSIPLAPLPGFLSGGFDSLSSEPQDLKSKGVSALGDPVWGDFDGNGTTDILSLNYVETALLMPGNGPNGTPRGLLRTISNGSGGTTSFTYGSSAGAQDRFLPFVLPVVSRIDAKDEAGVKRLTTSYVYRGGFFDRSTREFFGFREVDSETPDGTVVTTTIHQKSENLPRTAWDLRGLTASVSTRSSAAPGSSILTEYEWRGTVEPDLPPSIVYLKTKTQRITSVEPATLAAASDQRITEFEIDAANGNPKREIYNGITLEDGSREESVIVDHEYERFGNAWRETRTTIASASATVRDTRRHYWPTGELEWEEYWLKDGIDQKASFTYYPDGNLESVRRGAKDLVDSNAAPATTYSYDSTWTYPSSVNLPTTTDPDTQVQAIHALSHEISQANRESCDVDENGHRRCERWDAFGRKSEEVAYLGNPAWPYTAATITSAMYWDYLTPQGAPACLQTRLQETTGSTSTFVAHWACLDALDRPERVLYPRENSDGNGGFETTVFLYDSVGRASGTIGPYRSTDTSTPPPQPAEARAAKSVSYQLLRQQTDVAFGDTGGASNPGGIVSSIVEYRPPFRVEVTDFDGRKTTRTLNTLGLVGEIRETMDNGATAATKYEYNAAGDLVRVQLPGAPPSSAVRFVRDTLGRITMTEDPDLGTWEYWYDGYGNLWRELDPVGRHAGKLWSKEHSYDELRRPLGIATRDGSAITFRYDKSVNGRGRMATRTASDLAGTIREWTVDEFDSRGRAVHESIVLRGQPAPYQIETGFDLAGRLETLVYPGESGYSVTYDYYPGTMHLKGVTDSIGARIARFANYGLAGHVGTMVFGNDAVWTQHYQDRASLATTGIRTWKSGLSSVMDLGLELTGSGTVSALEDYGRGAGNLRMDFAYDAVNRLRREELSNSPPSFSSRAGVLGFTRHPSLRHAVGSAVLGATSYQFQFDSNGNNTLSFDFTSLSAVAPRSVSFDSFDMPSRVAKAATPEVAYLYDGSDRVQRTSLPAKSTVYVSPLYEIVDGVPVRYVFGNGLRLAMIDDGNRAFFFHKDAVGSTVAVTDAGGNTAWTGAYTPFGLLREDAPRTLTKERIRYLFADGEYESDIGLYYFGARYYDPSIGRFLSPDKTIPRLDDPQSLNSYAYARNNPLSRIDPNGEADKPATDPRVVALLNRPDNRSFQKVLVGSNNSSPLDFQNALLSGSLKNKGSSSWLKFLGLMGEAVFIDRVNSNPFFSGYAAPFPKRFLNLRLGRLAPDVLVGGNPLIHPWIGTLDGVVTGPALEPGCIPLKQMAAVVEVKTGLSATQLYDGRDQTIRNARNIGAPLALAGLRVPAIFVMDFELWDSQSAPVKSSLFQSLSSVGAYIYPMPRLRPEASSRLDLLTVSF